MESETRTKFRLRDMTPEDLPQARELSRELNWPHRTVDWRFLLDVGSGIVVDDGHEVVGTAMCWQYGSDAATVGLVIVSPRCRGVGVGQMLMAGLLDRLPDRSVMLNATVEGLPLYRKLGFAPIRTVYQHQGTAFSVPIAALQPNERVRPLGARDVEAVVELDRRASGMDRTALIATLIEKSKGVILDRQNQAVGFALFRRFGRGFAVGPTVAPDQGGAKALISHWLGSNAGMFCRLDVPEESGLSDWLDHLGLPLVGRVTQMVRGAPLRQDPEVKLFSLVSQALG